MLFGNKSVKSSLVRRVNTSIIRKVRNPRYLTSVFLTVGMRQTQMSMILISPLRIMIQKQKRFGFIQTIIARMINWSSTHLKSLVITVTAWAIGLTRR